MKQIDLVVVDLGNSCCKIGAVHAEQLLEVHRLDLDECAHQPWRHRVVADLAARQPRWLLSGSNPPIISSFADWLAVQGQMTTVVDATTPLPLEIDVESVERVGRDRLLQALAVQTRPAIVISAGSAVTVDAIGAQGQFLGGAIFPGLRLMARALKLYTARLPLIDPMPPPPALPGKNTEHAINAGIVNAVIGGIVRCVQELLKSFGKPVSPAESATGVTIYLTGGNGPSLATLLPWETVAAPHLALEGMIIASRTLWK